MYKELTAIYESDLRIPHNEICTRFCDAKYKVPLLPWHIGKQYGASVPRIVFVGKPHREDLPTQRLTSGLQDGQALADTLFRTSTWAYWSYTREILAAVFGNTETGWEQVALTNIIKCTSVGRESGGADRTTSRMKDACIRNLGVIRAELRLLRPTHVIMYLGSSYDSYIKDMRWDERQAWRDLTAVSHVKECGGRPLKWYEKSLERSGSTTRFLRVGHPQGKPKKAYIGLLRDWLLR